jgi:glutamate/aspartate transport system substrate-binding protein
MVLEYTGLSLDEVRAGRDCLTLRESAGVRVGRACHNERALRTREVLPTLSNFWKERGERMKLGFNFRRIAFLGSALLGITLLLGVEPVNAQQLDGTLKNIKATSTLNLGYLESAPPFSFTGPDKKPVGYSIDLCTHIASAIQKQLDVNLKLNWVVVTPENRMSMVEGGKVDIECGTTTASLSRQERVDFSLMTFVDGGGLLIRSDSPLQDLSDLAEKRVAVIPGTTTQTALAKFLKEKFVTVKEVPVKDHVEGRTALENGTVEAYASDSGILIGLALTATNPKRFALAEGRFSYEPYGFMMRRNDPAFRLAVNRALAALYRSGDIVAIYDRWFGSLGKPSDAIVAMYMLNGLPE